MDVERMLNVIVKKAESGNPAAIAAVAGILTAAIEANPQIAKSLAKPKTESDPESK